MKTYFIYLYSFKNGKKYIGQTYVGSGRYGHRSQYRGQLVYHAMKKYPDYKKEILCHCCEGLVDYLECFFIQKYDSTNPDKGYNCEYGGCLNKHIPEETRKKKSIPIICEELNKEFYGAHEAARQLSLRQQHITACCRGKRHTCGGYHFHYKEAI